MSQVNVENHLLLLGVRVKDKVTGFTGVVVSISFDLYGCIQAIVNPGLIDNKPAESHWFDVNRLDITEREPVMKRPDFFYAVREERIARGENGPAEKPPQSNMKT